MTVDWRRICIQVSGTAVIGISSGFAAVLFHWAMNFLFQWAVQRPSQASWPVFLGVVLVAMVLGAFLTGMMMKNFAPDAPGSGIPQVKAAYQRGSLDFSWNLLWVKFVGGALSIGTGSSLGREGPTIHIGAAIASKIATLFHLGPDAKGNAVCAGSAAGLAAAFSSPLAGVTLVLEEIAGGHNMAKFTGPALFAAALASSVVYLLSGDVAALPVGHEIHLSWDVMWFAPVVAIVAGLAGLIFQSLTLRLRRLAKASRFSVPVRLALGALAGGVISALGFFATGHLGAFGLGESDLLLALQNKIVWQAAAFLLVAKLLSTVLCYGSGGCGGIFAPIIFFGGMAGVMTTGIIGFWVPLDADARTMLALVGMTSCLGAVVRAPLTSILIVMEMTWQLHVLPALMVGAVISAFMNRLCFEGNFYDEALRQDGIRLKE